MGRFERIASAVAGAIPVEADLDMGDSNRVRNLSEAAQPGDSVRQLVGVEHPTYGSVEDVPDSISPGEAVFIDGSGSDPAGIYVEDGT